MFINKNIEEFPNDGYVVLRYQNIEYLNKFRDIILQRLQQMLNSNNVTLENFHTFVTDNKEKIDIQHKLSSMIWDEQLHINILKENIDLYYFLIGKDLDIQVKPHLRIVRPNYPEDNIGFHRDSFYGNIPYEISSFISLVALDESNALMVEVKSHQRPPIPYANIKSKNVDKGSKQHELGFPYSPKVINKNYKINKLPIPMEFGDVLIFGADTTHGQDINYSNITRWSIDIRIKNSFSVSSTKDGYYKRFSKSVISQYVDKCYSDNANT